MGAASARYAARRAQPALGPPALALLCLAIALVAAGACAPAEPLGPTERAAPRHPIQAAEPPAVPGSTPVAASGDDAGRLTPGPNSRVSPTPDMAPRVRPADRPHVPSVGREVEDLRRDLREQRKREPEKPGPPAGTIDQRPGTVRPKAGTIEVPR